MLKYFCISNAIKTSLWGLSNVKTLLHSKYLNIFLSNANFLLTSEVIFKSRFGIFSVCKLLVKIKRNISVWYTTLN